VRYYSTTVTPSIKALPEKKKQPKARKTATYTGRAPLLENMSALIEDVVNHRPAPLDKAALAQAWEDLFPPAPPSVLDELDQEESVSEAEQPGFLDAREARLFKFAGEILEQQRKAAAFTPSILPNSLPGGGAQGKDLNKARGFMDDLAKQGVRPTPPSPMGTHPAQQQAGGQFPGGSPNAHPIQSFGGIAQNPMNVNGNAALGTRNSNIKTGADYPSTMNSMRAAMPAGADPKNPQTYMLGGTAPVVGGMGMAGSAMSMGGKMLQGVASAGSRALGMGEKAAPVLEGGIEAAHKAHTGAHAAETGMHTMNRLLGGGGGGAPWKPSSNLAAGLTDRLGGGGPMGGGGTGGSLSSAGTGSSVSAMPKKSSAGLRPRPAPPSPTQGESAISRLFKLPTGKAKRPAPRNPGLGQGHPHDQKMAAAAFIAGLV
jgi:hypothetical protein